MKNLFTIIVLLYATVQLHGQAVGIGTTNPTHPLHLLAYGDGFAQESPTGVKVGFFTSNVAFLATYSDHPLSFATNASSAQMTLATNGNFGIGTMPEYKLDVKGRVRIKSTSNSAGIWLDGTINETRSFVGMLNNDYVGLYGSIVGWNVVMNVENGNTGIGTTTPTQRLDVNGNLRIRGSVPKKGSVLTSTDANGNAQWMDPVAFRVTGLVNNAEASIPTATWTKVNFNSSPNFNYGLNYQPFLSQFVCAEKGIYQFNLQLSYHLDYEIWSGYVRINIDRGGNVTEFFRYEAPTTVSSLDAQENSRLNVGTGAVELLPGDKIWVETYINGVRNPAGDPSSSAPLLSGGRTWFSGNLLMRT